MEIANLDLVIKYETKNAVRYEEITVAGQPPAIGTLYVKKAALRRATEAMGQKDYPQHIRVVVEVPETGASA